MNRRKTITLLGFTATLVSAGAQTRPNVIFVLADELRAHDLGYMGNKNVKTPVIDRLADHSVVFTNMISGCPVSCPYRGSLLTGQYPLRTGVFVNDVQLDPDAVSIAKVYRAAGYQTAYIGKWHLDGHGRSTMIPSDRRQGFEYWKVLECTHDYFNSFYWDNNNQKRKWDGYDAYAQTADAVNYIKERKNGGKPFLLFLSWGPPHTPFDQAPENLKKVYRGSELSIRPNVPDELKQKAIEDMVGYYAHISALDSCIGVLQKAITDTGIERNTIFIFTSDHGAMVRSHGYSNKQRPYEESINVPFLIHYPGLLGEDERVDDMLVTTPDIMPTLLGLSGLSIPSTVEGHDKSMAIKRLSKDNTVAVLIACYHPFGQFNRESGGKEYRGVRTKQYTYVKDLKGPWLLFDNIKDPFQMHNLVNEAAIRKVQKDLEKMLSALLEETGDEFLPGMDYIEKWKYVTDESGTVPYVKINFQGLPIK
jgi:arylsulfatase A-like enzyme